MNRNYIEIMGHAGADADVKDTQSGRPMTTLSIAVTESWRDGNEKKERTEWFRVVAFDGLAKYAAGFRKGNSIMVVGKLRTREYEDKDGRKATSVEIVANAFYSLIPGQRADTQTAQEGAES